MADSFPVTSLELCAACSTSAPKYTCPACERQTCSLACYRAHNQGKCYLQHTTSHAQQQADALAAQVTTESERDAFRQLLGRHVRQHNDVGGVHSEDGSSSEDDDVAPGDDNELETIIKSVHQSGVHVARPWWARPSARADCSVGARGGALVVDVDGFTSPQSDDADNIDTYASVPPAPPVPPAPVAQLSNGGITPHPSVRHQVTVVTYAYCVAYEAVGGAIAELAHDVVDILWAVCEAVEGKSASGSPSLVVRSASAAWEHCLCIGANARVSPVATNDDAQRRSFAILVAQHGALAILAIGRGALLRMLNHANDACSAVLATHGDSMNSVPLRRARRRRANALHRRIAFLSSVVAHAVDVDAWHAEAEQALISVLL
ncbi:hypothetical protein PPROV_000312200 [Pycnococcus provasolii]|uniref:HIT-type domain-containing protein n=1 Tax=Pycnococcus provasolii TaxID=41880 RepID=A0A830HCA7_9CHLO|nr:hypothetical protein PPROV_000312200 [Pycnococcus provasolii]